MIQVRTLGTAEIVAGRHRITPDSSMLFALALYMSVSAGQRVRRSRLLDLFWPDASDGSRRHALRQLLYRLRKSGFPLSLDGEELLVPSSAVESDVGRVLASCWPEEASREDIESAAHVLPGYDPPMPELYREWLDELRSRVTSQYRRALLRQIEVARRVGRWHDVDGWARRCLEVDPLNEEATLAHAEAIAMSGSKAKALQIIDEYLDELGDRNRIIGLPAKVLRRRVSENAPERVRGEPESVPLIGREREVAQLVETLTGTLSGRGTALLIVGAAGIGKSRLTQELLTTAGIRGWRTISARLQASDADRPLGVFVDLFAALLQLPGALGCSPDSLAQLRLLTEHKVSAGAEAHRSQEAEAVQERLRIAARDLIESVLSEGPLVLVIDDAHWCDDASIRLLQYLVARTAEVPMMWALTARVEGRHEHLREAMSDLRMQMMQLAPLAPDEANSLFDTLARRAEPARPLNPPELASAVTGGNPLFVVELARHVRETGQATSLPQSLRALIRDRAKRLSPIAQHVLHSCAVLGRYSSVPRVASVLEINTADLLACIEELDALGIVGVGRDAEALSLHDLWREELLSTLLPASRKLLHHRCGLVLEGECRVSRAPSMVWEAAQHLLASGSEGRALSLLEECAQHQLDNGLPAEAAKTFDMAVQASTTDVDRLRALTGRIAALRRVADWDGISTAVSMALDLDSRSSLHTSPHTDLELLETEVLWRTESDLSRSLSRSLACALDDSASIDHRSHAAVLSAIVSDNVCRFEELTQLSVMANTLSVSTAEARANVLSVQLIYESILGSLDRATQFGAQLVRLERDVGSVRGLARALRFSCNPYRMTGEYALALTSANEALELAENHHLVGEAASAADIILTIHLETENLDAANSWIARSEDLAAGVGARYARASLAVNQAIYALLRGDPERAEQCIEPYKEKHYSDPIIRQRMLYLSILARSAIARHERDRLAELAPALRSALDLRRNTGAHDFHVASYAQCLEVLGERLAAVEYVRNFVLTARRDRTEVSANLNSFLV